MTVSDIELIKTQFRPHLQAVYNYFLNCDNVVFWNHENAALPTEGERQGIIFDIPLAAPTQAITNMMQIIDENHIDGQTGILRAVIQRVNNTEITVRLFFCPADVDIQEKSFNTMWSHFENQPIVWSQQELQ